MARAIWILDILLHTARLWHVTTLVNIPCYFLAAWAIIGTVKRFDRDPKFYAAMSALIVGVFLFFP